MDLLEEPMTKVAQRISLTIDENDGPVVVDIERLDYDKESGTFTILWWAYQQDGRMVLVKTERDDIPSLSVGYSGVTSPPTGEEVFEEGDVVDWQTFTLVEPS